MSFVHFFFCLLLFLFQVPIKNITHIFLTLSKIVFLFCFYGIRYIVLWSCHIAQREQWIRLYFFIIQICAHFKMLRAYRMCVCARSSHGRGKRALPWAERMVSIDRTRKQSHDIPGWHCHINLYIFIDHSKCHIMYRRLDKMCSFFYFQQHRSVDNMSRPLLKLDPFRQRKWFPAIKYSDALIRSNNLLFLLHVV